MKAISKQCIAVFSLGLLLSCFTHSWAQNQNGILLIPFTIHDKTDQPLLKKMINNMLFSRLNTKNCMIVKDFRNLGIDLSKSLNVNQAKKIAKKNGLDHILTGSISIFGGQYSIDAQIWALKDQKPNFTHSVVASSEKEVIPQINEMSLRIRQVICQEVVEPEKGEVQQGMIDSFRCRVFPQLNRAIHSLTVADINQDHHPELIAADKHSVYMFDISNNSLNVMGHFDTDHTQKIIWLDSADMNKDQKPEFYVTAVHKLDGHLTSFVLVWNNDRFQVIFQDAPYYFRCFRRYDHTVHLIGQTQTLGHFFSKKICLLRYNNKKFIVEKTQFIPPNSHFASFHQGRFTGPDKSYVVIRANNKMEILDRAFRSRWLSETLFAESKKVLTLSRSSLHKAPHENEKFMYLNQRIQVDDVDHDNIDEIIVSQQNASSGSRLFQRYRQFDSGVITCLKWNGLGMVPVWKTPKINGYISDYIWFDQTGEGNMCLIVSAISAKSFFKSRTTQVLLLEVSR
jgi:hypothetical protein